MPHQISYRVYYEDTDAAGVVYYANYLKFAERARTEALRESGYNQSHLLKNEDLAFAVVRVEVDYRKPARLDDVILVETSLQELKSASMTMHQNLKVGDVEVARAIVTLACVSKDMRATRIPEQIRTSLTNLLGQE